MILSDLLDSPVTDDDGARVGFVIDVRFVLDGPPDGALAAARLHGILVCPRTRSSMLGYERSGVREPWPIAAFLAWRHRGTVLVPWSDVSGVSSSGVRLRAGYARQDPALP